MSNLIPLVGLSSRLYRKVRDTWFRKLNEKKDTRGEVDWLAERPESWYQGPLIFPTIFEERSDPTPKTIHSQYEEKWSD